MIHNYPKAGKYSDLKLIYSQCSGPGGLKAAEFIADRMGVKDGKRLLDVGFARGYQTCFLAKEYNVFAVGIDPENSDEDKPNIEHLMKNARSLGVEEKVLGIKAGVPDTLLPSDTFDYIYSCTTFEMLRVIFGKEKYMECLKEVLRLLKPGGIFGMGEPMHLGVEIPEDMRPYVSNEWKECFIEVEESRQAVEAAGFKIVDHGYAEDAQTWWDEYSKYNNFHSDEFEEKMTIKLNQDRWLSFGYVIAQKI
ncbi:MAG: methyltransferase domain-containing protein [Clostridia bacterium]|nr:methyltransferase domain-containing protein [Clostridia bacterium]